MHIRGRAFLRVSLQLHMHCTGYDFHGKRGARAYNGGLGAKPPEAECLFAFACPKEAANLTNYYVHVALYCKENIFLIELSLRQIVDHLCSLLWH